MYLGDISEPGNLLCTRSVTSDDRSTVCALNRYSFGHLRTFEATVGYHWDSGATSNHAEPEHICQVTFEEVTAVVDADTVVWDSEDDLGRVDGDETVVITLDYVNSEDVTQTQTDSTETNGLLLPSATDLSTLAVQSIHGEAVQTAQIQMGLGHKDIAQFIYVQIAWYGLAKDTLAFAQLDTFIFNPGKGSLLSRKVQARHT
ncbi:hypothetical protein PAMP_019127 [Pampus punctatissimus]